MEGFALNINELVPLKQGKVAVIEEKDNLFPEIQVVQYALVDSSKHSFEYRVDDDVDVAMVESDRVFDCDELLDADFDQAISERDYSYYAVVGTYRYYFNI